jgi:hypothetical protein
MINQSINHQEVIDCMVRPVSIFVRSIAFLFNCLALIRTEEGKRQVDLLRVVFSFLLGSYKNQMGQTQGWPIASCFSLSCLALIRTEWGKRQVDLLRVVFSFLLGSYKNRVGRTPGGPNSRWAETQQTSVSLQLSVKNGTFWHLAYQRAVI